MKTKLGNMGLFATPDSVDALQEYIERFSGSEKIVAAVVMGMTWNLCAELTSKEEEEQ